MPKQRSMTEAERQRLEILIRAHRPPPVRTYLLDMAPVLLLALIVLTGLLLGGLALLATAFGIAIRGGAWQANPLTFYVALLVTAALWLGGLVYGIRGLRRNRAFQTRRLADLQADLDTGKVNEALFQVIGVKILQEPEHGMPIIFLRLSDAKVFVLYGPIPEENSPPVAPQSQLRLLTLPISKRRFWQFSGDPLRLPQVLPMALPPEDWPEDEAFCRVKWQNIERHYGGRSTV